MKQYVPEIMKAVVALPEQQVCGAVGLCSTSSMTGEALFHCLALFLFKSEQGNGSKTVEDKSSILACLPGASIWWE